MAKTFTEKLHRGYAQLLTRAGEPIVSERSEFQAIEVFDTPSNGRVLTLDNIVQITTRDECGYSEMLTHLPILEHGAVRRVMIVGGGDLAIAEEALKHKAIKRVDNVEIDPAVIDLAKKHFAAVNAGAVKDKRLKIHTEDAFVFLGRKTAKAAFDLIIADRPDPVGPAEVLFGDTFYARVAEALAPNGIAVFQNGVPFYQPEELTETLKQLSAVFKHVGVYLTVVPTYVGGFMALTWCSNGTAMGTPRRIKAAQAAFAGAKLKTDYYTPEIHAAAYALPAWIKRLVP